MADQDVAEGDSRGTELEHNNTSQETGTTPLVTQEESELPNSESLTVCGSDVEDLDAVLNNIMSRGNEPMLTKTRFNLDQNKKDKERLTARMKEMAFQHMIRALKADYEDAEKTQTNQDFNYKFMTNLGIRGRPVSQQLGQRESMTRSQFESTSIATGSSGSIPQVSVVETKLIQLEKTSKAINRHIRELKREQKNTEQKIRELETKWTHGRELEVVKGMLNRIPTQDDFQKLETICAAMAERQSLEKQINTLHKQYDVLNKVINPNYLAKSRIYEGTSPKERNTTINVPDLLKMPPDEREELFRKNDVSPIRPGEEFMNEGSNVKKLKLKVKLGSRKGNVYRADISEEKEKKRTKSRRKVKEDTESETVLEKNRNADQNQEDQDSAKTEFRVTQELCQMGSDPIDSATRVGMDNTSEITYTTENMGIGNIEDGEIRGVEKHVSTGLDSGGALNAEDAPPAVTNHPPLRSKTAEILHVSPVSSIHPEHAGKGLDEDERRHVDPNVESLVSNTQNIDPTLSTNRGSSDSDIV